MNALEKVQIGIENGFTISLDDGRTISVRAWTPFFPGMPALLISPEYGASSWDVIETDDLEDLSLKMTAYAPIDQWQAIHKPALPMISEEGIEKLNNTIAAVVQDAVRHMTSGPDDTMHKTQKPK